MASFLDTRLSTARLLLRPMRSTDAPALFAIFSDAQTSRYLSRPPWTSIEQAHEKLAFDAAGMAAGEHLCLGLERIATGEFIGNCALFKLDAQCRRAEIGYTLARPEWGSGLMHEALTALLNHGFDAMNLNRVEADIDPRNAGSARTLERLGFTREGYLRERWIVGGEVSDTALYGLLAREWLERPAAQPGAAR
jgi:ribosomal-protein-alanine N-acetyltransferase